MYLLRSCPNCRAIRLNKEGKGVELPPRDPLYGARLSPRSFPVYSMFNYLDIHLGLGSAKKPSQLVSGR
jgi:hypothetical protein